MAALSREEWVRLLKDIHARMGTAKVMEELFFQRRPPYAPLFPASDEDDAYFADQAAQRVDLAVASEGLAGLGRAEPCNADAYKRLFGTTYLGSPLSTGEVSQAAAAWPEVEKMRYKVAMASALHYSEEESEEE